MIHKLHNSGNKGIIWIRDTRLKPRVSISPMEFLVRSNNLQLLQNNFKRDQSLFDIQVLETHLLHLAAYLGRKDIVRWILEICPESISIRDTNGNLPIHCSVSNLDVLQIILKHGMLHQSSKEYDIGGLMIRGGNKQELTTLDMLLREYNWSSIVPAIKIIIDGAPILQGAIVNYASHKCLRDIMSHLDCISVADSDGRLPIHVAAANGLKWEHGMKDIVEMNKLPLNEIDPQSGLYPFALAALEGIESNDLSSIYGMLRRNVETICLV
mmetsp:Transcript_4604/g.6001  ORF Transcript_4604/g.6001 Transcript_4604/m.6001 type:complete len:269 (+) Transcript_4604:495-1301(+)